MTRNVNKASRLLLPLLREEPRGNVRRTRQ